jgi:hypothetical protein
MGIATRPVILVLVACAVAGGVHGASRADTARPAPAVESDPHIVRQWALRGVIVSGTGRSAVLEHLPSGRQELVRVGTAVTPNLSVIDVHADRVLLATGTGATTALRLSHGGSGRVAPPRVPPPRTPSRARWPRR